MTSRCHTRWKDSRAKTLEIPVFVDIVDVRRSSIGG